MPKVLRIINRLAIGGPTLNVAYLTRFLEPEFETRLLAGNSGKTEENSDFILAKYGIRPVYVPGMYRSVNPLNDLRAFLFIRRQIREFRPDIVHTHASKAGAIGRLAAWMEGVPVVVHTFHGHVFHSYFSPLVSKMVVLVERLLASISTAIIAISPEQQRELTRQYRIAPPEKVPVIPLGFDLDQFRTGRETKRRQFRDSFALPDDVVAIGIVGRLVPVKNHSLFVRAMAHLATAGHKVRAFIVGDGETREAIEHEIRGLGLALCTEQDYNGSATFVFTSWRKDMDVVYAGLDLVLLTSLNEGTPVCLIEAQAAGKAVLSTRVGGVQDIVMQGKTGFYVPRDDFEGYLKHLEQLVAAPDLREKMGKAGDEHVVTRFGYQRLVQDVGLLYHRLLEKKHR